MSEKYYVCSESELEAAINAAVARGLWGTTGSMESLKQAEAACRARPFEKYPAVVEAAKRYKELPMSDDDNRRLALALAALEEDV